MDDTQDQAPPKHDPKIRRANGTFVPRHQTKKGKKYSNNRQRDANTDLARGLVESAIAYGADGKGKHGLHGYLTRLIHNHPTAHAQLFARFAADELKDLASIPDGPGVTV